MPNIGDSGGICLPLIAEVASAWHNVPVICCAVAIRPTKKLAGEHSHAQWVRLHLKIRAMSPRELLFGRDFSPKYRARI